MPTAAARTGTAVPAPAALTGPASYISYIGSNRNGRQA
ncbi:hypothetical protein EDD99_7272 [Streptomyces sp. 846.5]|nr:hypothetical protein EDD99_7272 [Streptomyces sp. 846.5]